MMMGVYRTDYLMYGAKMSADVVDWDKHEALIEGRQGSPLDLIYDGMSGKYAVAGKVIAKSDPYEGLEFKEITDDDLPKDKDALRELIAETFGVDDPVLKLYLFSHFS